VEQLNVLDFIEVTGVFERKINLALNYAGLRLPNFKALNYLEKTGKITVSDLSRAMSVTQATTSVLANQLIKAGVVETIANSSDKRSYYLKMTPLGLQRLDVARLEVALVEKKITNKLPQDLVKTLNHVSLLIKEEL